MSQDSPVFAKAYDLVRWLLPATATCPKQQRFVLARQIEDAAFGCRRALLRAAREHDRGLAEADLQLAALRTYLRLACELRFLSINQYEHAARLTDELGQLIGGWQRKVAGNGMAPSAARAVMRGLNLRTANRNNSTPDNRSNNVGFRCASGSPNTAEMPHLHGGRLRAGGDPQVRSRLATTPAE
jgi:hypothetical protein